MDPGNRLDEDTLPDPSAWGVEDMTGVLRLLSDFQNISRDNQASGLSLTGYDVVVRISGVKNEHGEGVGRFRLEPFCDIL